jgi:hypothetical protein
MYITSFDEAYTFSFHIFAGLSIVIAAWNEEGFIVFFLSEFF